MKKTKFIHKQFTLLILFVLGTIGNLLAQANIQPGKIWYTDNYLYVNIPGNGIVVLNNRDASQPQKVGFIEIQGNVDLAVKGNILYANSNRDLVAIDISDPNNPKEMKRIPNIFTHRAAGDMNNLSGINFRNGDMSLTSLVINSMFNKNGNNSLIGGNNGIIGTGIVQGFNQGVSTTSNQTNRSSSTSKGGSLACFTLVGDYLYTIDAQSLQIFKVTKADNPELLSKKVNVGTDIETIFPANNKLFIGSQTGMYIYDITDPEDPNRVGTYSHTTSCDPVAVEGNYAYVTLRKGTTCDRGLNQLEVIDISNPASPKRVSTYPMFNPHGLGIDNGTLFVCDGRDGLKVFDAKSPTSLNRIAHFANITTLDVIPVGGAKKNLIMVGGDTIYQYSYKDLSNINLISAYTLK